MAPEAIILIADHPVALKLIAAWPNVPKHRTRDKTEQAWAKTAGVALQEVRTWWDMLMHNRFIYRDGGVDPTARQFVMNQAAKHIKAHKKA